MMEEFEISIPNKNVKLKCSSHYDMLVCTVERDDEQLSVIRIDEYGGSITMLTRDSEIKVDRFKKRYTGTPIVAEFEW